MKNPKIFIVSGKARNGKDTTCNMIREYYEDKGLKTINLQYSSYIKEYAKKISDWDGSEETKPRELLQYLGTEIIREKIDYNFFVNRIIDDIKVYSFFFDIITISDARAKVEIDKVRDSFSNVKAIKVIRTNFYDGLTCEQRKHFTETDLDDYENYDYILENDSTLDDLNKKVIKLLEEINNEY